MNADSFILGFAAINYLILIILLLVIYKKKIKIPDHVKKTSKFLLFAFLFYMVWFAFVQPRGVLVSCTYETKTCRLYHMTVARNEPFLKQSFILPKTEETSVKKQYRANWKGIRRSYYEITLKNGKKSFPFPLTFVIQTDAEKEAERLKSFLNGETKNYVYSRLPSSSGSDFILFMALIFLTAFGIGTTLFAASLLLQSRKK